MKLLIILCLNLFLLTSALSVSLDDYRSPQIMDYWDGVADSQTTSDDDSEDAVPLSESIEEQLQSPDEELFQQSNDYANTEDDSSQMMNQDDESLPKESVKELKQMLANNGKAVAQASCTKEKVLQQGGAIALQFSANKKLWLGCGGRQFGGRDCPHMFMNGGDWRRCAGQVFQIYRPIGPGAIQSGDFVGLYYTKYKQWFTMSGDKGHRDTCAGLPKASTGFSHMYKWFECPGGVFQIFAFGKAVGANIENRDTILLYYHRREAYIQFQSNIVNVSKCPLAKSSNARPPQPAAYDECPLSVAELSVK